MRNEEFTVMRRYCSLHMKNITRKIIAVHLISSMCGESSKTIQCFLYNPPITLLARRKQGPHSQGQATPQPTKMQSRHRSKQRRHSS